MDILDQIRIKETLGLLEEWNIDIDNEMAQSVYQWVLSVVKQVCDKKHTKSTDFFIEKCDSAVSFQYDVYYMDEDSLIPTELVFNLLKAAFFAYDLTLKDLSAYKIRRKKIPLFVTLGTQVMELRKEKQIPLREKLKKDILEELDVDLLVGLEKQRLMFYEFLCNVYFSETQSVYILNYLKNNCLNNLIKNVKDFGDIQKEWFLKMSDIIINTYLGCENIAHQDLLKEIKRHLSSSRKPSAKESKTYADTLLGNYVIQEFFDDYELALFFGNDFTLDKAKKRFEASLKDRMLKRHAVSEYIFDQMKVCSNHTNCKFNCKYDVCRYKTLLELLGSHLPQYNVTKIEEKVGEDVQTDFLFVIEEKDENLVLVLCSSVPFPPSSIYMFEVRKKNYLDAIFMLQCYFESEYECKRKELINEFQRFGRCFGIIFTRVYRK